MPPDNEILPDLARYAEHSLDVDGRTFDQFVLKAQSRGVALADIVHAVNDVYARYVLKGKTFDPLSALLYSCSPANRDMLPPRAKTFKQWREEQQESKKTQAQAEFDAEEHARHVKWSAVFFKRGLEECKRIAAEFMIISREFKLEPVGHLGAQLEMDLSARGLDWCKWHALSGTALAQDAAFVECWARGTWQFPARKPDNELSGNSGTLSPQMIEYEKMERRLDSRDGLLALAFMQREDKLQRINKALGRPNPPCEHLSAEIGKWAASGCPDFHEYTIAMKDDKIPLKPTLRAFLAVLEHEARGETYNRQYNIWTASATREEAEGRTTLRRIA